MTRIHKSEDITCIANVKHNMYKLCKQKIRSDIISTSDSPPAVNKIQFHEKLLHNAVTLALVIPSETHVISKLKKIEFIISCNFRVDTFLVKLLYLVVILHRLYLQEREVQYQLSEKKWLLPTKNSGMKKKIIGFDCIS